MDDHRDEADTAEIGMAHTVMSSVEPVAASRVRYTKIRDSVAGGLATFSSERYFHSFIERDEANELLTTPGYFLVRQIFAHENTSKSPLDRKYQIMFVNQDGMIEEVPIRYSRTHRCYYVNEFCFNNPGGLIAYHRDYRVSVKQFENKLIKHGINKERWEIFHEQIQRIKRLGSGNFGQVFKAYYRVGLLKRIEVAVKILTNVRAEESEVFIKEAQTMRRFQSCRHENVVHFLAVACYQSPIMLVMEFCPYGSLKDHLGEGYEGKSTGQKLATEGETVHWIAGAARGLDYLHTKAGIVHRDVAARNVVIGSNYEAKITDFGMSVKGTIKVEKLQNVPIRYLPRETLQGKQFDQRTDVWAFGVLIWECYNECRDPYDDFITDIKRLVFAFRRGYRLAPGPKFPVEMWKLCSLCWEDRPESRPTMEQVAAIATLQYQKQSSWTSWMYSWWHKKQPTYRMTPQSNWLSVFPTQPKIPEFEHDQQKMIKLYEQAPKKKDLGKTKEEKN
ncbi:unnamed protein product, partial [Mesorhabditis belari]|uniref:Tyrosine-protein kinase n=1 Tax=Mesorhabditis belari TaxID=2138241 RepID=A0AAF3FE98_9BILA